MPAASVNCLLNGSGRQLWIGTSSGLAFLQSGRVQVPSRAPASLREQIFGLAGDESKWLWVATSNHVLRVDAEKLGLGTLGDTDVREYGLADGLHGTEGVKRHRSVVADPLGRIWHSMNRGLSVVHPNRVTGDSAPSTALIQSIDADGKAVDQRGGVRIPAAQRNYFPICRRKPFRSAPGTLPLSAGQLRSRLE